MKRLFFIVSSIVAIVLLSSYSSLNENADTFLITNEQESNPFQKMLGDWNGNFKLFHSNDELALAGDVKVNIDQQQDILLLTIHNSVLEGQLFGLNQIKFNYAEKEKVFFINEKNNQTFENSKSTITIKKVEKGKLKYEDKSNGTSVTVYLTFIQTETGKDPLLKTCKLVIDLKPNM